MYYVEKMIDGVLMCKSEPRGEWREVSKEGLNRKIETKRTLQNTRNKKKIRKSKEKKYQIIWKKNSEEFDNIIVAGITSNKSMNGISLTKQEGAVKDSVIKLNYILIAHLLLP